MAKPQDVSAEESELRKEFNQASLMAYQAWRRADELRDANGDPNLIEAYETTGRVMQDRKWVVLEALRTRKIADQGLCHDP